MGSFYCLSLHWLCFLAAAIRQDVSVLSLSQFCVSIDNFPLNGLTQLLELDLFLTYLKNAFLMALTSMNREYSLRPSAFLIDFVHF